MERTLRHCFIALVFAAACAPQMVAAEDRPWTALLAFDEGGLEPDVVRIVAGSEAACAAEVAAEISAYRGVTVIEPCQPATGASAITDDNDYPRRTRRPKSPSPVTPPSGGGGGGGSSGGGAGGGGVGGW